MEQQQTTTTESDTNIMEYTNKVVYAYVDGQLIVDDTYYIDEVYDMNEWL